MKNILVGILGSIIFSFSSRAQGIPETIASKIARRMKDTLALADSQRVQIYHLNMQLYSQKSIIWQQYTNEDSLQRHLQFIENTRDSLYRPVLGEEKYILYRSKKLNLLNNN